MAFIPTPNAVRASVLGTIDGQLCVITLWFVGTAPATTTDLDNLAGALIDWVTLELLPLLSNGYSVFSVNVVAQDTSFAPSVSSSTGLPAVGAVNSATQAPQVAGVVSFRTANRGRSSRGRNYVPGVPENALATPGTMGTTFLAAMRGAYQNLNGYVTGFGYFHVVVSHFFNKAARTAGFVQTVTTYLMDAPLDTQRRRSVGRGV